MDSLNQLAKRSPRYEIIGMIAEEQRRIKLLRTEQSELRTLVDEQQTAIQHIVSKLREQVATLSELRRRDLEAFQMLKLKHQQVRSRYASVLLVLLISIFTSLMLEEVCDFPCSLVTFPLGEVQDLTRAKATHCGNALND